MVTVSKHPVQKFGLTATNKRVKTIEQMYSERSLSLAGSMSLASSMRLASYGVL